ncbi:MAG: hypothetical protein ABI543_09430 [Ignavibacteria bacterium]
MKITLILIFLCILSVNIHSQQWTATYFEGYFTYVGFDGTGNVYTASTGNGENIPAGCIFISSQQ